MGSVQDYHRGGIARSFPGNPYDGDTLAEPIEQAGIPAEGGDCGSGSGPDG